MDRRALAFLALDAETAANLLCLLIDPLEERGETDLVAHVRLVLRQVERIGRGIDRMMGDEASEP